MDDMEQIRLIKRVVGFLGGDNMFKRYVFGDGKWLLTNGYSLTLFEGRGLGKPDLALMVRFSILSSSFAKLLEFRRSILGTMGTVCRTKIDRSSRSDTLRLGRSSSRRSTSSVSLSPLLVDKYSSKFFQDDIVSSLPRSLLVKSDADYAPSSVEGALAIISNPRLRASG